jgi:hypothetical protein
LENAAIIRCYFSLTNPSILYSIYSFQVVAIIGKTSVEGLDGGVDTDDVEGECARISSDVSCSFQKSKELKKK